MRRTLILAFISTISIASCSEQPRFYGSGVGIASGSQMGSTLGPLGPGAGAVFTPVMSGGFPGGQGGRLGGGIIQQAPGFVMAGQMVQPPFVGFQNSGGYGPQLVQNAPGFPQPIAYMGSGQPVIMQPADPQMMGHPIMIQPMQQQVMAQPVIIQPAGQGQQYQQALPIAVTQTPLSPPISGQSGTIKVTPDTEQKQPQQKSTGSDQQKQVQTPPSQSAEKSDSLSLPLSLEQPCSTPATSSQQSGSSGSLTSVNSMNDDLNED